ncbi:hypothetical protein SEA_AMETHYST_69 [Streptomyces phage Amethyst]|uniref:Uncharacterized protein n=1 Tax=Streptomyces phage Amethyst TaxID=2041205 RepID=A0A291LH40_9CAUD|nr:hypothetical protein KGG83_gp69 [Streptomyces phage Amethyst]ATI18689.1 hypothetical protein SEA_AMETHYST_69 [Streptomyces phage Amethyst]
MPSTEQIKKYLTDERAQDIVATAAYGGITYWATEPTEEEFAGRPEGKTWTIVEGSAPHPIFPFDDEREVEGVHHLNADDIRAAYAKLLDIDQQYVNREYHGYILSSWMERDEKDGIETGDIDAGTADIIVQLAALGEIRYG